MLNSILDRQAILSPSLILLSVVFFTTLPFSPILAQMPGERNKDLEQQFSDCNSHIKVKNFEMALKTCQASVIAYQQAGNRRGEAQALSNFGLAAMRLKKRQMAASRFEQALSIAREISDRELEAKVLIVAGLNYGCSDLFTTLEYLRRANLIAESLQNHELANISRQAFDELSTLASKVFEAEKQLGEPKVLADLFLLNGMQELNDKKIPSALFSFEQALPIYQKIHDRKGEQLTLMVLGSIYALQSRFDEGTEIFERSLVIARELGDHSAEQDILDVLNPLYELRKQSR
jgi:tetratricopeptide (TPR) repeat protein